MDYKPIIGLEIHVELKTKTKMFCNSANDPLETHPNVNICPICTGQPGILPVINEEAVKMVILTGLALNCGIAENSFFERKNYFYPDLPKGYQISQYQKPLCENGYLEIANLKAQIAKRVHIRRIHLEEDTGRLIHLEGKNYSLVDFNRAGIPLMELVTEPDLENGAEVKKIAEELQLIFRYLKISDADMEKGQMRVEVNISLSPSTSSGQMPTAFGTKVEIKNLNSIKSAADSVDYEIKRQTEVLESGKKVVQETRGWDELKQETFSQRLKEESQDYRYFPEPDLPPLSRLSDISRQLSARIPELPSQRRKRFKDQYGLGDSQVEIFTVFKNLGDYYEKVATELDAMANIEDQGKTESEIEKEKTLPAGLHTLAANYIITEFPPLLHAIGEEINDLAGIRIAPENFAQLMVKIFHKKLSSTAAKTVLKEMARTGLSPEEISANKGLEQISNADDLIIAVEKVIASNQRAVGDYKKGKQESIKFLVGKVMQETKGRANPRIAAEILERKLRE